MIGNLGPPLAVAQSAVYADVREGLVEATQVTSLESALSEDKAVDQRAHSNDFEWPSGQDCTSNEMQLNERIILHPELDFLDQQTCLRAEEHVFYGHDVIQVPLILEPGGYRIDPSNTKLPKSCNSDKFACLSNVSLILSQREYEIVAQQMSQVESRTAEEILDRITSIKLRSMPKESKERSNQVQNQIGLLLTQVTSLEKELVSSYARIKASQSKQMKAEDQEAAIHERFLQLEATHRVTLKSLVQNEKELEREREQRILMQSNVDELKKLCEVAELELRTLKAVEQNQEEWKASKAALAQSRTENDILKQTLQKLKSELPKLREQCLMQAQNTISEAAKSLRSLHEETKYREGSLREDCQHERLQRQQITEKYHQVTGRIRVFCRVRPSTCLCKPSGDQSQALLFPRPGNILIVKTEKEYSFDEVLDSTSSQTDVYMRVAPIVSSFTDGHNACIMAYGQTGSGKTYTMLGDSSSPEMEGVIPRALRQVFSVVEKRKVSYKDTIRVSMVEIYNDQMLDLLQPQAERTKDSVTGSLVKAEADLTLRSVSKWSDVTEILTEGSSNRTIAATSMNLESSRSHTLLFLRLSSQCLASMDLKQSKLCLVDLAGSERISRSLVVGDRLKEAQHINKSLSALGDVIHALQHKAKHVPYRNSKLTFTLRDMLSGRAKTLLMLQLSPEEENCEETICSLNFGARVSQVQLGAVQISVESGSIVHLQKEKATMMHTINCLENELKHLKSSRGDTMVPLKGEVEAKHRRKPLLEKAETQTITPSGIASSRRLSNSMTSESTEFAHSETENGAGTIVTSIAPQPHYQKSRSLAERRPSNFATSQSGRNLSLTHGDTTESNKLESKVSKATTKNTLVSAKSKTAFRSAPARYTKTNTAKHIAKETVLISSMREQVKSGRRPSKALSSSQKTTWK